MTGTGISEFIKKNKLTAVMTALFFVGMAYGALVVGFGDDKMLHSLSFMTKGYMNSRAEQSMAITFFNSLWSTGCFILALFLLGFSSVSIPAIVILPFFKGLGLGTSLGYLYITYALKGIAFSAAVILPAAIFSTFAMILASREAFKLSLLFLAAFVPTAAGRIITSCNQTVLCKIFSVIGNYLGICCDRQHCDLSVFRIFSVIVNKQ